MNLISRISNLNQSLVQSNETSVLANEMVELQTIHNEIRDNNDLINRFFEIKVLFEKYNQSIDIDEEYLIKLRENINKIDDNFAKEQSVDAIKKGSRSYAEYKSNIKEFIHSFKNKIENGWIHFCKVYEGDDYDFSNI